MPFTKTNNYRHVDGCDGEPWCDGCEYTVLVYRVPDFSRRGRCTATHVLYRGYVFDAYDVYHRMQDKLRVGVLRVISPIGSIASETTRKPPTADPTPREPAIII